MDILTREFELDCMEAEHTYKTMQDQILIDLFEAAQDIENGVENEIYDDETGVDDVADGVKEQKKEANKKAAVIFFEKLMSALKKFMKAVTKKVSALSKKGKERLEEIIEKRKEEKEKEKEISEAAALSVSIYNIERYLQDVFEITDKIIRYGERVQTDVKFSKVLKVSGKENYKKLVDNYRERMEKYIVKMQYETRSPEPNKYIKEMPFSQAFQIMYKTCSNEVIDRKTLDAYNKISVGMHKIQSHLIVLDGYSTEDIILREAYQRILRHLTKTFNKAMENVVTMYQQSLSAIDDSASKIDIAKEQIKLRL